MTVPSLPASASAGAVVRFDGVTKEYGPVRALDGLTLDVRPGEVFGLLGRNGAGKTTALRILLASLRATAGRVEVFGLDSWNAAVAVHRRLGYVTGELGIWPNLTGSRRSRSSAGSTAASIPHTAPSWSRASPSTPRRRGARTRPATARRSR